jgi:hypothetical protein
LHLWKSGKVDIQETDRPMAIEVPEDDIKELSNWCGINNWKFLYVNDRLLTDPRSFEFWMRMYRCGLVQNDQLRSFDESEMVRLIRHMMRYSPTTKHKKGPSIPWGRITHMEDRYDGSRWWSFWKSVNRRTMMETMTHE